MLSLVRGGPKILMIETTSLDPRLEERVSRMGTPFDAPPGEAVDLAGEEATLIFLFLSGEGQGQIKVLSTPEPPETVLCDLVNQRLTDRVDHVCTAPGLVVMRLLGDLDGTIPKIREEMQAHRSERGSLLRCAEDAGTVVYFTTQPLNRPLRPEDFHPEAMVVDAPYSTVLAHLRGKAMDYLAMALGTPDWNDMEIRIYDAEDRYPLQYRRLMTAVEGLDLGVVLGEAWGKDQAMLLMSVSVYRVRLFTPLPPEEVKKVALALEYRDDGSRCVDLDVFAGGKKVPWTRDRGSSRSGSRNELALEYREDLFRRLSPEAREQMRRLDGEMDRKPS